MLYTSNPPMTMSNAARYAQLATQSPLTLASTTPSSADLGLQKRFPCGKCGKSFSRKYNLKMHMRTHLPREVRQQEFQCHACGKRFVARNNLTRHQRSHHGAKRLWKCRRAGCTEQFTTETDYRHHQHASHNISPRPPLHHADWTHATSESDDDSSYQSSVMSSDDCHSSSSPDLPPRKPCGVQLPPPLALQQPPQPQHPSPQQTWQGTAVPAMTQLPMQTAQLLQQLNFGAALAASTLSPEMQVLAQLGLVEQLKQQIQQQMANNIAKSFFAQPTQLSLATTATTTMPLPTAAQSAALNASMTSKQPDFMAPAVTAASGPAPSCEDANLFLAATSQLRQSNTAGRPACQ